jgi:hypothetical protein
MIKPPTSYGITVGIHTDIHKGGAPFCLASNDILWVALRRTRKFYRRCRAERADDASARQIRRAIASSG